MSLFDPTQLALERALSGAALRQRVLSENLANANTPGYQRADVDFHGTLAAAMQDGTPALQRVSFSAQADTTGPMRADGGTVDPDREATAMAQNGLESDALASVLRGRLQILRSAIGGA